MHTMKLTRYLFSRQFSNSKKAFNQLYTKAYICRLVHFNDIYVLTNRAVNWYTELMNTKKSDNKMRGQKKNCINNSIDPDVEQHTSSRQLLFSFSCCRWHMHKAVLYNVSVCSGMSVESGKKKEQKPINKLKENCINKIITKCVNYASGSIHVCYDN